MRCPKETSFGPRFPRKPKFGSTVPLFRSVRYTPPAPTRHVVVRFVLCLSVGYQDQGNQPNCASHTHTRRDQQTSAIGTSVGAYLYRRIYGILRPTPMWRTLTSHFNKSSLAPAP